MRYNEGARLFYRLLAEHLLIEVGPHTAIQLVVPEYASPPEEDSLAVARALATREEELLVEDPPFLRGADVDPGSLPEGGLVIDCRGLLSTGVEERFHAALSARTNVVVLVRAAIAQLGCRVVSLDWNDKAVIDAITASFAALLGQLGFREQAIEMPTRFLTGGLRQVQSDFSLFEKPSRQHGLTQEEVIRFCESIRQTWTYRGAPVSGTAVRQWVEQFAHFNAISEALASLLYLNREGFIPKGEITNRLVALYHKLMEQDDCDQARIVSIQRPGKSEQMLLYELRDIDEKGPAQFSEVVRSSSICHLVCIDDVIGSGTTFIDCLFEDLGTVDSNELVSWLRRDDNRITIIAAVASEEGTRAIENDTRSHGRVKVASSRLLSHDDSIFSSNRSVFENAERREAFREACTEIGRKLSPSHPLGWGNCQWFTVTDYNTPDCSLPVLWAEGSGGFPWQPLFPRR